MNGISYLLYSFVFLELLNGLRVKIFRENKIKKENIVYVGLGLTDPPQGEEDVGVEEGQSQQGDEAVGYQVHVDEIYFVVDWIPTQ